MSFFEISMYYLPVLYTRYLRKILEEGMMILKEKEKSIGSYLEYCSMQISSFAKSELCTATSIQLVEQWASIQTLWREKGEMPLINRAVNGVNACWQEPAWVIYNVQILCKPFLAVTASEKGYGTDVAYLCEMQPSTTTELTCLGMLHMHKVY